MTCSHCGTQIDKVIIYLSCYQIGTLQDGKIISYGDYEDMQPTETVCHACLEPVEVAE